MYPGSLAHTPSHSHPPVLACGEPHFQPDLALHGGFGRPALQRKPLVQAGRRNVLTGGHGEIISGQIREDKGSSRQCRWWMEPTGGSNGGAFRAMALPKGIKWPLCPHPYDYINMTNKHKIILKFSNFKMKWPKSVEKVENGGSLGPLGRNCPPPQPIRWIRQ